MAAELDLRVTQGANLFHTLTCTESSSNTIINITDYTFTGNAKKSFIANTVAASFVLTKANSVGGELNIELGHTVTQNLAYGKYVYTIFGLDTLTNRRYPFLEGNLIINPGA